jgi:hypothetical protein
VGVEPDTGFASKKFVSSIARHSAASYNELDFGKCPIFGWSRDVAVIQLSNEFAAWSKETRKGETSCVT